MSRSCKTLKQSWRRPSSARPMATSEAAPRMRSTCEYMSHSLAQHASP